MLRSKLKSIINRLRPFFAVKKSRYAFILALSLIVLIVPFAAHADVIDSMFQTLAEIFLAVAGLLGKLLIVIINILIVVVQYNDFVNATAVAKGWYIVRDLCNMFFVVVLLVIAFGTILKWDKYRYEKLLPNLLIMAVLVNFSKVICGFFIDFGQIIMLTFVNAFKDAAAGNFTQMFGLKDMLSYRAGVTVAPSGWEYVAAGILAVALILIAIVVMTSLVVVFLVRIVMLWILVVLSPLAYLLSTLPGTAASQASKWWSQFGKWVTIGPILAFFVWLALTIMATPAAPGKSMSQDMGFVASSTKEQGAAVSSSSFGTDTVAASISSISSSDNLLSFAIAIAMLVMALMTAQQMGGVAGGFAGKAMGAIKNNAMKYTGARAVSERYQAYQGAKERDRKQKAQKFGETMYGGVQMAKGAASGAIKGGIAAAGAKFATTGLGQQVSKISGKVGAGKEAILAKVGLDKASKEARAEKNKDRQAQYDAYDSDRYTDRAGNNYVYNRKKDKYVRRDKDTGKIVEAKDSRGNVVQKMTTTQAKWIENWRKGTLKSRGINNEMDARRISEQQKAMAAAGTSDADLRKVVMDSGASRDKRLAASMTLAIKKGFETRNLQQGRDQIKTAKGLIGNNSVLMEQFNDTIDKNGQAHLNYNLKTDEGKQVFGRRIDEGYIDPTKIHASALSEQSFVQQIEKFFGTQFPDVMKRIADRSNIHKEKVESALLAGRDNTAIINPTTGKSETFAKNGVLDVYARTHAEVSGNVFKSFSDSSGAVDNDALAQYMSAATAPNLNKIKVADFAKLQADAAAKNADAIATLTALVDNIELSKFKGMNRDGKNPELLQRIKHAMKMFSTPDPVTGTRRWDEIMSDTDLKNMKERA